MHAHDLCAGLCIMVWRLDHRNKFVNGMIMNVINIISKGIWGVYPCWAQKCGTMKLCHAPQKPKIIESGNNSHTSSLGLNTFR